MKSLRYNGIQSCPRLEGSPLIEEQDSSQIHKEDTRTGFLCGRVRLVHTTLSKHSWPLCWENQGGSESLPSQPESPWV